jgi:LPS sulfotransferase NodH
LHEAAQWMIDNRGTPDAFGFKAGFAVLMAAAELGVLSEMLDRSTIVLLRRRDRLAQAVSLVKSQLSGRTHSGQQVKRELSDADYDADAIAFQLWVIEERERQFADLAGKLCKEPSLLFYEDICTRPAEHVAAICQSMGLDFPEDYQPNVRVQILRDELSGRWIERFRAERAVS